MCTDENSDKTNGPAPPIESWFDVDWPWVNKTVTRLRRRIFKAARSGDFKRLRQLQRLAVKSEAVLLFSIRHVTYNSGRVTPGPDDMVYIKPESRLALYNDILHMDWSSYRPLPVKRIYLEKPDGRLRPLGIPTVKDRVLQMVIKTSLEPEWEAYFESSSYGFRPRRSVNDAMNRLFVALNDKSSRKWILDADISQCFDSISHEYLLNSLKHFPYKGTIEKWLLSGIVLENVWFEVVEGTPQGSVISPLLSNIALHGLEQEIGVRLNSQGYVATGGRLLVRYADDFVVLCYSKTDAIKALQELKTLLAKRGLHISEAKTRVVHITEGFDFLGFNVKLKPRNSSFKDAILKNGDDYQYDYSKLGLYISPSDKSVKNIKNKIRDVFRDSHGASAQVLISRLNPIIRGWANSKRAWHSTRVFHDLDHHLFDLTWAWARRQHPNKTVGWLRERYFKHLVFGHINNRWVFTAPGEHGRFLYQFKWFVVERHVMVRNLACPDDPAYADYWTLLQSMRDEQKRVSLLNKVDFDLASSQQDTCPVCNESLFNGEDTHKHHILEKNKGGKDSFSNLVLLHLPCHYQVHHASAFRKQMLNEKLKVFKVECSLRLRNLKNVRKNNVQPVAP